MIKKLALNKITVVFILKNNIIDIFPSFCQSCELNHQIFHENLRGVNIVF